MDAARRRRTMRRRRLAQAELDVIRRPPGGGAICALLGGRPGGGAIADGYLPPRVAVQLTFAPPWAAVVPSILSPDARPVNCRLMPLPSTKANATSAPRSRVSVRLYDLSPSFAVPESFWKF